MIPVPFGRCAAWLHDASGGRGAVLLPAYGYEDLCSRHALRCLADRLAGRGIPTLRFDYEGTGDSAGLRFCPDQIRTWMSNAAAAISRLRETTGVREFALVGMRLGALLAPFVAARHGGVERLVLLAPPNSGASYVRELRALSLMLRSEAAPDPPEPSGALSVAGFRLDAANVAALKGLDFSALRDTPSPRALLLTPEGTRGMSGLADRLAALGTEAERSDFPGYGEMMCDPTAAQVPEPALDRVAEWVAADAPACRDRPPAPGPGSIAGEGWVEQGVVIGSGGAVGVSCTPSIRSPSERAVLFLNAGGIHHAGWAGMHVAMARRLAREGVSSLRLDFPGVGDAAPWAGPRRITFYDPGTLDHVVAALDWLERQGASSLMIAGTCSGAHHAFHAALRDERVSDLVMLNTLCFVWGPSYSLPLHAWKLSRPKEMASKQRIATGTDERATVGQWAIDTSLPLVKRTVRGLMEALKTGLTPLARRSAAGGDNDRNAVESWFRTLSRRGTRVTLVYGKDDPGRDELERHMGPNGRWATALPGVSMHLIPDTDHALTSATARGRYSDIVLRSALARRDGLGERMSAVAGSRAVAG